MRFRYIILCLFLLLSVATEAQPLRSTADSIRRAFRIPELAYAVVSSDSVLELGVLGTQRMGANYPAKERDRFHIGSNTKAITALIAALMVQQGQVSWNTKFLDLFPELKPRSRKEYYNICLQDLLCFRGKLPPYTYTFSRPAEKDISGTLQQQHYALAKYFLSRPPMQPVNGLTPSNADYILAGMMLEKASGKTYKHLVEQLGQTLDIAFGFDYPNLTDTLQPWGHNTALQPLPPAFSVKLNWLLAAGNINVSLPDYAKLARELLKGLKNQSTLLPAGTCDKLLYGMPGFAFGWFNERDEVSRHHVADNEGNADAFITTVHIIKEADRAYIIFTNSAHPDTNNGIELLLKAAEKIYGR